MAESLRPKGTPRADEGRRKGFDDCFSAHYAEVLAYCLRRVELRGQAEDAAAETFVIAWRRFESLPHDPVPWLYGVARRVIANQARGDRRRSRLVVRAAGEPSLGARDPADVVSERDAVLTAIGKLAERDREVLRLAAWEGLDARRAASALGCTRGAFAVRLHRARRRLARELAVSDDAPDERNATSLETTAGEGAG